MDDLLKYVESWPSLVLVVAVFGFAPGFCLRLIVLAYPRSDPRRAELIAELYAVPRIQRPLWVAEQLEVALFEGLAHRVSAVIRRLTGSTESTSKDQLPAQAKINYRVVTRSYGDGRTRRCSGCDHEIRVGRMRVVTESAEAWASADWQYWHTSCWDPPGTYPKVRRHGGGQHNAQ